MSRFQRLYNPVVRWLLRSPLHRLLSGSTVLLTYTGRRSGRRHATPVGYRRDGATLLAIGAREHRWWRNLRDGAPVTVRVRGRDYRGTASAFEGAAAITEGGLLTLLRQVPQYRAHWRVALDADGMPTNPADLARIAADNAVVRIRDLTACAEGVRS